MKSVRFVRDILSTKPGVADIEESYYEESASEYRNKRRSNINWWIVLFFIAFALVNFLLILFMHWNEKSEGLENLTVIHMRMTFNEARNYCKANGKQLLITTSNQEENSLVERLRMKTEHWGNCTSFLLGFKAERQLRFEDPYSGEARSSLDLSFEASLPTRNQTCVRVNRNFSTTEISCADIKSQCWLCNFKRGDNRPCTHDRFSNLCYGLITFTTARNYESGIEKCRVDHNAQFAGLMLTEKNLLSKKVEFLKTFKYPPCGSFYGYGIYVKTNMKYVNPEDNSPMAYTSQRFLLTESNYECLAVDKDNDYKLVTESCAKPMCVLCV